MSSSSSAGKATASGSSLTPADLLSQVKARLECSQPVDDETYSVWTSRQDALKLYYQQLQAYNDRETALASEFRAIDTQIDRAEERGGAAKFLIDSLKTQKENLRMTHDRTRLIPVPSLEQINETLATARSINVELGIYCFPYTIGSHVIDYLRTENGPTHNTHCDPDHWDEHNKLFDEFQFEALSGLFGAYGQDAITEVNDALQREYLTGEGKAADLMGILVESQTTLGDTGKGRQAAA